jgi:hypothetical protein
VEVNGGNCALVWLLVVLCTAGGCFLQMGLHTGVC